MYYPIEKRCLNNLREREQKYIEEFRKRVLTNVIKKRNNLRESNRINFFHGRGGIVYPPFILTFFLLPSPVQASNEKGARVSTMEYIKKKRKRKRKRKMARNQRAIIPFVLSHLRAVALHCCCRAAHFLPRLSDAALSSRYIAAPAELLHFKSQSCTYKRSYRQGLVVRPTYFIHISYCVSRTNNSPRFGRSLFRSKEKSEKGGGNSNDIYRGRAYIAFPRERIN